MRIVLYDDELFEPITVFDVPQWAVERLKHGRRVHFPVFSCDSREYVHEGRAVNVKPLPCVTVWFEKFIRKEVVTFMAFSADFQNALKLAPTYLPGQVGDLRSRCEIAFIEGLLAALTVK